MNIESENTVYGSFGTFDAAGTANWTDEDWRAYDEQVAAEIAEWEAAEAAEWEIFADYDDEPPF